MVKVLRVYILRATIIFEVEKATSKVSNFPSLSQWIFLIHIKIKEILSSGLEAHTDDS